MEPFAPIPAAVLDWMASSWVNGIVVDYAWTFPTLETLHFTGMCLLFGPILVMDLRLIGFARGIPAAAVDTLIPLSVAGFAINSVTGLMFFFSDPHRYAVNIAFQLKMLLVLVAGLNALCFWLRVTPLLASTQDPPPLAKAVGVISLVAWTAVLCLGRLIPYLGTG